MRFKLDENLPRRAVDVFEQPQHDVESVLTQKMGGSPDRELSAVVREEDRILVTLDTDFGDIRAYPPGDYPGFVLMRLDQQDIGSIVSLLRTTLPILEEEFEPGTLWIVEDEQIRIRD